MWGYLKDRIGLRCPMTLEELKKVALEEWHTIPQSVIDNHCRHFRTQMLSREK